MRKITICGCDPQTNYECGGMARSYCEYCREVMAVSMVLCASRHSVPDAVDGAIFEKIDDPMNFMALRRMAWGRLAPLFNDGVKIVNIYVTGLTPALLTVINICREHDVMVNTWHYDNVSNTYKMLSMTN